MRPGNSWKAVAGGGTFPLSLGDTPLRPIHYARTSGSERQAVARGSGRGGASMVAMSAGPGSDAVPPQTSAGGEGAHRDVADLTPLIRRVVSARVHDPHAVEDLVQETLVRLLEPEPTPHRGRARSTAAKLGVARLTWRSGPTRRARSGPPRPRAEGMLPGPPGDAAPESGCPSGPARPPACSRSLGSSARAPSNGRPLRPPP